MCRKFRGFYRAGNGRFVSDACKTASVLFTLILVPMLMQLSQASAQTMRTYVAGTGTDTNPCTLTAPCRTLQAALNKTAPGGTIQSLNSADYGSVTITRSVSIVGTQGTTGVLSTSVSGITISAAPSDVVSLRGLEIDGGGSGGNGVLLSSGAALTIDDSVIRGFATGISVSSTNPNSLSINNTSVLNNTIGVSFQSSAPNIGVVTGTHVVNNETGVTASGANSSSAINLTIQDSVVANNSAVGVLAGAYSVVTVANSLVANNGIGLEAQSASAVLNTSESTLTGNSTGWTVLSNGQVSSTGNNAIGGNLAGDPAPPPPSPPPSGNYLTDGAGGYLLDSIGGKISAL